MANSKGRFVSAPNSCKSTVNDQPVGWFRKKTFSPSSIYGTSNARKKRTRETIVKDHLKIAADLGARSKCVPYTNLFRTFFFFLGSNCQCTIITGSAPGHDDRPFGRPQLFFVYMLMAVRHGFSLGPRRRGSAFRENAPPSSRTSVIITRENSGG